MSVRLKLAPSTVLWLAAALLAALSLKAALLWAGVVPFNSDEAVVALMARHILAGERPIFFYGQAYMGSLDAFLVAAGFALLGEAVWVIRLVQAGLYAGTLLTTFHLGREIFKSERVGVLAAWLLAIPAVNVSLYTTVSLGGYGEALLLGNLILLVALRIARQIRCGEGLGAIRLWAGLGFLAGLGLWAFGLTLIYSIPALVYLSTLVFVVLRRRFGERRRAWQPALAMAGAGLIGSAPWWRFAAENGLQRLLWELGGGAIAGAQQLPWLLRVVQHLLGLLLFGSTVTAGLRPPWEVRWLALPLFPFVLFFWMLVLAAICRRLERKDLPLDGERLLAGVALTLIAALLFTPFGADPSGRYFVPLAVPLALFAAWTIQNAQGRLGRWLYGLAALVLAFHLWGTIQAALKNPPGLTTQFYAPAQVDHRYDDELMAFLKAQGETRGYTNYWVAYPLAFHSGERLLFVPRLPYHPDLRYTERDDRYGPYGEAVAQAERVAYITTHNPRLDERLQAGFAELGVGWEEAWIGDYHVFYDLTRPVRPEEVGLGETTP